MALQAEPRSVEGYAHVGKSETVGYAQRENDLITQLLQFALVRHDRSSLTNEPYQMIR